MSKVEETVERSIAFPNTYTLDSNFLASVQTLDSTIHWINQSPADKYQGNQLDYSPDRDLSAGERYPAFE